MESIELSERALGQVRQEVAEALIEASNRRTEALEGILRVAYAEQMGGLTPLQKAYRDALDAARVGM